VEDLNAGGVVFEGTSDICVVGNLFSSVRPKAIELKGQPSERVNFSGNVLTDVESDHANLNRSTIANNLE
jgi:hypothetical protein